MQRSTITNSSPEAQRTTASVEFRCPRCEEAFTHRAAELASKEQARACPSCDLHLTTAADPPSDGEPVSCCWLCGNREFYIQKDFNRRLGLVIVAGSALVVLLVMLLVEHRVGIVLLLTLALADWIVYQLLANVTVCYLCQSIYRGFPLGEKHSGFYLGTEEKHKKLRQKWLERIL